MEMLSLMAKELAKTGAAPKLSIRKKRQRGSRGSRSNKGIRDRVVELKSSVIQFADELLSNYSLIEFVWHRL